MKRKALLLAQLASEQLRDASYAAAKELFSGTIDAVQASTVPLAAKMVAFTAASKAHASACDATEQQHADRIAAAERHYGQPNTATGGNPDTEAAVAFIAGLTA
jgi:hypothetical protein